MRLKNYFFVSNLSLKKELEYRGNLLIKLFFSFIPLIALISLFGSLYKNEDIIEGLTYNDLIAYMVIGRILMIFLSTDVHWEIHQEIRSGEVTKYISRPINYLKFWIFYDIGKKISNLFILILPIVIVIYFNGFSFNFISVINLFIFIISVVLSYFINFLIYYVVSLLTFHFNNITAFFYSLETIMEFLSGSIIPIAFLGSFRKVVEILPFSKVINLPVNIIIGYIEVRQALLQLALQMFWIIILLLLSKYFWIRGLQRYEGRGI